MERVFTVKQARQLAGLTQVNMANEMGISRDSYRKIELRPDLATVGQAHDISRITQIPVDQISFCL